MSRTRLPRNTTHQAEGMVYGWTARMIHRVTGIVVIGFVAAHVIAQSVLHVPLLSAVKADLPWLEAVTRQPWLHAIIYFSIVFHTLYGLKLFVEELGVRIEYRLAFWLIVGASGLVGLREVARYAGV